MFCKFSCSAMNQLWYYIIETVNAVFNIQVHLGHEGNRRMRCIRLTYLQEIQYENSIFSHVRTVRLGKKKRRLAKKKLEGQKEYGIRNNKMQCLLLALSLLILIPVQKVVWSFKDWSVAKREPHYYVHFQKGYRNG